MSERSEWLILANASVAASCGCHALKVFLSGDPAWALVISFYAALNLYCAMREAGKP